MGWIYLIESPSGKAYVGQTRAADPATRFRAHCRPDNGCIALRRALKKYGGVWENGTIKNFAVSYYFCPDDQLDAHEELMIESLGTLVPDGYNLKTGGKSGRPTDAVKRKMRERRIGKTHSEATRLKIGAASKGKTHSETTRAKISIANKGKTLSEAARMKISAANKGKVRSEATRAKMSAALSKRVLSAATLVKMSESHRGTTASAEAKAKMSAAHRGKPKSEEHRANISAAMRKRWATKKAIEQVV